MSTTKEEAKRLIDKLSEQATWDDLLYEFYVKKKIALSLKAAEEGMVVPHELVLAIIHGARDLENLEPKPWEII